MYVSTRNYHVISMFVTQVKRVFVIFHAGYVSFFCFYCIQPANFPEHLTCLLFINKQQSSSLANYHYYFSFSFRKTAR